MHICDVGVTQPSRWQSQIECRRARTPLNQSVLKNMQLKVSIPVVNLLIYEPFEFAGVIFTPPSQDAFPDERNTASILLDGNLSTAITALSGVQLSDFNVATAISFEITVELVDYPTPSRQDDERVLAEAVFRAEAVMDLIRFDYCRLDIPQYSPMMAGYIPTVNRIAVSVYDEASGKQRLIAREPDCPIMIPGIGLELESAPSHSEIEAIISEQHADQSLGIRLRRLLRAFGQAFTASSDDQKILNLIFALDGLLTPENCYSDKFKSAIGKWLGGNATHQASEHENFAKFYEEVRNHLVHRGKSYEQLGRDRKADLFYLQGVISRLLTRLSQYRQLEFSAFWKQHT